ncbi:MAG: acyl-CoA dehydrogenase family protein [Tenuifilaceae bacterium]|nr:acyl-CoA dehydrogenase family protein [Tenuifilaceae bacterium]
MHHPLINKQHNDLREQVRIFAEKEIKPLAQGLDERSEFSVELTKAMGKIGLFGMNLPVEFGGRNLDTLSYIIAVEELARVDSSQAATMAAHNSLGITPIYKYGNSEQQKRLLPSLTSGEGVWAFGLTEPNAGSDARAIETTALLKTNQWVVNGQKIFITNSASELSKGVTLLANTSDKEGQKEFSAIIVEREVSEYKAEPIHNKMVWRAADTGLLTFNNTIVPEQNLLGERGRGMHYMLETLDSGRLSIAAVGLGLAQGAFEMANAYAKKRHQFGKSLSKIHAISDKLAEMDIKLELARNYLYYSCWLKDNNLSFKKQAAISKLYTSEIAKQIADEAVQIFGGYGLFKNNDIERFYRDQRILSIGEGTTEILKLVIARSI